MRNLLALPLATTSDYLAKMLDVHIDSKKMNKFYDDAKNRNQIDLIGKIISTENAIYLLRRSNETDGSTTDVMVDIRRSFIDEYEKSFGEWINDNEEEMY